MIAGSEVTAMIENLRPLTQEQRQGARNKAHDAVIRAIGPKPAHEHSNQSTISKYSPTVTRLIFLLCSYCAWCFCWLHSRHQRSDCTSLIRGHSGKLYRAARPKRQLVWLWYCLLKLGKLCFHWHGRHWEHPDQPDAY